MGTRLILQIGHEPALLSTTSACVGQVHDTGGSGRADALVCVAAADRPMLDSDQEVNANWARLAMNSRLGARPTNAERTPGRRATRAVIVLIIGAFAGEAGLLTLEHVARVIANG